MLTVDNGSGWITDRFSETTIAAHFAIGASTGTISLDRVTGVVDTETVFQLPKETIILYNHGICEPSKKKF